MTDTWNPAQYDKFQREREQPFFDLMALVRPAPDMRIVDLKVHVIVYPHVLASREAVVDRFVAAYRTRLFARLEDARPFFYPFKRILCWGQRA